MRTSKPSARPPELHAPTPSIPASAESAPSPASPADVDLPTPRPRPAPRTGFLGALLGSGGRKALLTGAVAAVMLGASLGHLSSPESSPRVGAPVVAAHTQVARQGDELIRFQDALQGLSELLAPLGISRDELRASLVSVSASVELTDGHLRQLGPEVRIEASPGARLHATVSEHGISLSMNPGLRRVVDWGIDSEIDRVSYRFADGSFQAAASGLGPDDMHSSGVAEAVAARFGPMLPSAMRAPGYSPREDPELAANFQQIFDLLRPSGAKTSTPTAFSAPRLSMVLRVPSDLELPLADGRYLAQVAKGTRIDVSFSFTGSVRDPRLEVMNLRFSEPIEISAGTERALMKRIDLRGVSLQPGVQLTADYALGAEGVVDGLRALVVLTATLAEPRLAGGATHLSPTRLEGARKQISELIDRELEPALTSVIQTLAPEVSGLSLERVFGIEPRPTDSVPPPPTQPLRKG